MNKIICIGECSLDVVPSGASAGSMPGGRIATAAAILGRASLPVAMASEASADPVGDILVGALADAGVDTAAVDRFTQGHSPLSLFTPRDDGYDLTRYEAYGDGGFDIVWPRVDDRTIVVFGGYYVLDSRMRERLVPFLNNCSERKAVMVYVPGFSADRCRRMTLVMPAILENLELADMVIARDSDLNLIFGSTDHAACYRDRIDFYCRSMVCVDSVAATISYHAGRETAVVDAACGHCATMLHTAGVIAGTVAGIYNASLTPERLGATDDATRRSILESAAAMGAAAVASPRYPWQLSI